jgi:transcriptional regulator with GAF, ATPase, and Fis domain
MNIPKRCWFADFTSKTSKSVDKILSYIEKAGDFSCIKQNGSDYSGALGLIFFNEESDFDDVIAFINATSQKSKEHVLGINVSNQSLNFYRTRLLLHNNICDILNCSKPDVMAETINSKLQRWFRIEQLLKSTLVEKLLVGSSSIWLNTLRQIIEVALFSDCNILIAGNSGTGKEAVSRLIHEVDGRRDKKRFITQDCTTIVPELSGSEFFGHEKGAFTNAVATREGVFALANGGTLFLDEIGELPPTLQAELLRVVQEGVFKKVGSNIWQKTDFRLVCATNRDLWSEVNNTQFRLDLFFRISGWTCRLPNLEERREDIPLLVNHFLKQRLKTEEPPPIDDLVLELLTQRSYSGNVRELQQLVNKIATAYIGKGTITIGCLPLSEIPKPFQVIHGDSNELDFIPLIDQALTQGWTLKEIKDAASDAAIEIAVRRERGNVQKAAKSLAVTDRTIQLWRSLHKSAG